MASRGAPGNSRLFDLTIPEASSESSTSTTSHPSLFEPQGGSGSRTKAEGAGAAKAVPRPPDDTVPKRLRSPRARKASGGTAVLTHRPRPQKGEDALFVSITDVWIPSVANYWVQATLVFDEDMDEGEATEPHLLTSFRSDSRTAPPIGSEAVRFEEPPPLELSCSFKFRVGALSTLRVRDLRLSIEVIAVDPGDGSMAKVASDVCPIDIDSMSGTATRGKTSRLFTGTLTENPARVAFGSYTVEMGPDAVEGRQYQEAPQGEEPVFSVDRLPTTIQEEGSFMSDSVIGPDVLTPNRLSEVMRDPRMQTQTQPSTLECNFKALTDYQETVPPGDPSTHPGVALKLTSKFSNRVFGETAAAAVRRANAVEWPLEQGWMRCSVPPEDIRDSDTAGVEVVDPAAAATATPLWFPLPFALFAPYHQYFFELVNHPPSPSPSPSLAPGADARTARGVAAKGGQNGGAPLEARLYAAVRLIPLNPPRGDGEEVLEVHLMNAGGRGLRCLGQWVADLQGYPSSRRTALLAERSAVRTLTVPGVTSNDLLPTAFGGIRGKKESDVQMIVSPPDTVTPAGVGGLEMYFTAKSYVLYSATGGLVFELYRAESPEPAVASPTLGGREGTFITQATTDAVSTSLLPAADTLVATACVALDEAGRKTLHEGGTLHVTPAWLDLDAARDLKEVTLQVRRVDNSGRGAREGTVLFTDEYLSDTKVKPTRESAHAAATKVQAAFRGHQTRKELKRAKPPDFPLVAGDGAALARSLYGMDSPSAGGERAIDVLALDPSAQWSLFEAPQALLGMAAPRELGKPPAPVPKVFAGGADKVQVNQQQFGAIVANLEHRQALISRLQSQIDVSSNTIRDQVKDLVRLRDGVAALRAEGTTLAKQLTQHKEALRRTMRKEGVLDIPRDALIEAYSQVAQRFKQEDARNAEYKKRIQRLQNARITLNEAEKDHLRLQRKHMKVCGEVQRLQGREAKRQAIEAAVLQQKEIILRLEALVIANGVRIDPNASFRSPQYKDLVATNRALLAEKRKWKKTSSDTASGALNRYVERHDHIDPGHRDLERSLKDEIARLLDANTKLAAENGELQAQQLTHRDQDLHFHMANARARERDITLRAAVESEKRRHDARMRELRAQYSELTMSISGAQRAIDRAAHVSTSGGSFGYRKEKSIELTEPPDLGMDATVPFQQGFAAGAGVVRGGARPVSPRTRELQEYANAIKQLHNGRTSS